MRYDKDRKIVRNILKTADIVNTFNGGVSQPKYNYSKEEDHFLIKIKIPGVELEKLGVEIINSNLIISHPVLFEHEGSTMDVPHVVATFPMTVDIDYKNVSAFEEDGVLKVKLPFSEMAGGYRKSVDINR